MNNKSFQNLQNGLIENLRVLLGRINLLQTKVEARRSIKTLSFADTAGGTYDLIPSDDKKFIVLDFGLDDGFINFPNSLPIGFEATLVWLGTGDVEISATEGASLVVFPDGSSVNSAGNAKIEVIKYNADTFYVNGNLA